MKRLMSVMCVVMLGVITVCVPCVKGETVMIEAGKTVTFYYTLTVEGQVVDSSKEDAPLEYVQGDGKIIKGLEEQMEGLTVGDRRTITVAAAQGYGEVNPQAFRDVPKANLPENIEPQVGQVLQVVAPNGGRLPVVISEIKDDTVVLNLNHPLAGKELQFDITIVDIK